MDKINNIEIVKIVRDAEGKELYRIIKEDGNYYKTYKKTIKVKRDITEDLNKTPDEAFLMEIEKRKANRRKVIASNKGNK